MAFNTAGAKAITSEMVLTNALEQGFLNFIDGVLEVLAGNPTSCEDATDCIPVSTAQSIYKKGTFFNTNNYQTLKLNGTAHSYAWLDKHPNVRSMVRLDLNQQVSISKNYLHYLISRNSNTKEILSSVPSIQSGSRIITCNPIFDDKGRNRGLGILIKENVMAHAKTENEIQLSVFTIQDFSLCYRITQ